MVLRTLFCESFITFIPSNIEFPKYQILVVLGLFSVHVQLIQLIQLHRGRRRLLDIRSATQGRSLGTCLT